MKLESNTRDWLDIPLSAYRQWKRRLRKRHRWLFELLDSAFFLPLIAVYITVGVLGLIEVATRNDQVGHGVIYPYYSKYWDAMGGIMEFSKEGFYEFLYWTAGAILFFGLFLLYTIIKKDRDSAYEEGQPMGKEAVPDPEKMKEIDLMKELNDIMHVLYEVYPQSFEDWAEEMMKSSDPNSTYVLWRRMTNVYSKLEKNFQTIEEKESMFWALWLYVEGTRRPGKIVRRLTKDGMDISVDIVKEIIAEYEAERDRFFLIF